MKIRPCCAQAAMGLALVAASAQAQPSNPLVGRWNGQMAGVSTNVQYKPDGTAAMNLLSEKRPYIINARYQVQGGKLVQTTTGQTVGGRTTTLAASNRTTETYHFRIIQGRLTLRRADGSIFTLKKLQ